jgi:hypothetical protein
MRILTKNKKYTKMFKINEIVWSQIGKMESVKDKDLMEPSKNGDEFALGCLDIVNSIYAIEPITKEIMKHPDWEHWKKSCKMHWHYYKSKCLFLRSYRFSGKDWLMLKVDNETPIEVFDKLGIQSKDRIAILIGKHNDRLIDDSKRLGYQPKGYLPRPNND